MLFQLRTVPHNPLESDNESQGWVNKMKFSETANTFNLSWMFTIVVIESFGILWSLLLILLFESDNSDDEATGVADEVVE